MIAIILSNGVAVDHEYIKSMVSEADMLICADGGARHAYSMGLTPNLLIGDIDSVSKELLNYFEDKKVEIITYPCEKDETDTQLAVEYAVDKGAKEIVLVGCTGCRFDHTFANISLLIWLMKRGIRGKIIDSNNEINVIDRYIRLYGNKGDKISLLSITPKVTGIFTKGLKYVLEDGELCYDKPKGVSNEMTSSQAEIVIRDGMLLVIKSWD